jgi:hypothetical protein
MLLLISLGNIAHYFSLDMKIHNNQITDRFGISEIYPTKTDGREWYVNMDNPKDDRSFYASSNISVTRQSEGSWQVTNPEVRLNVITLPGQDEWRDVEMTGYVMVLSTLEESSSNSKGNHTSVEVDLEEKVLRPGVAPV